MTPSGFFWSALAFLISLAAFFSSFLAAAILPCERRILAFFNSVLAWALSLAGLWIAALIAATPLLVVFIVSAPLVFGAIDADPLASGVPASRAAALALTFRLGVGMNDEE